MFTIYLSIGLTRKVVATVANMAAAKDWIAANYAPVIHFEEDEDHPGFADCAAGLCCELFVIEPALQATE